MLHNVEDKQDTDKHLDVDVEGDAQHGEHVAGRQQALVVQRDHVACGPRQQVDGQDHWLHHEVGQYDDGLAARNR